MNFLRLIAPPILLALAFAPGHAAEDWALLSDSGGIEIYKSPDDAHGVSSYRAVTILDAPTESIRNVLDDIEGSPRFMPYVAEVRVLSRKGPRVTFYQRIRPPFLSERDYTLHLDRTTLPSGGSEPAYKFEWTLANEAGPPEKEGIARSTLNSGYWLIEPVENSKTRVTYVLRTDVGSKLPEFLVSRGNRIAIPKLFRAVLEQTHQPRYQARRK